ncbi:MAG: hypothetical protein LIP12_04280 [Clostridiales bacterium]|nr:hypothetical protein [Clostridiales bacterium]
MKKEIIIMTKKYARNRSRRKEEGRAAGHSVVCTLAAFLLIVLISIICVWYFTAVKSSQPHNAQLVWRKE